MLEIKSIAQLEKLEGSLLGKSNWLEVTQKLINDFADTTGDHQWIHVDEERAKKEMPNGKTIAHGYLILSLLPKLNDGLLSFSKTKMAINYGLDKVRFTNMVSCNSNIRLHLTLSKTSVIRNGAKLFFKNEVEIQGLDKPACIAESLVLVYF